MERGEGRAQLIYQKIAASITTAADIATEEDRHEEDFVKIINEERLNCVIHRHHFN
jgi:hypothetical protein